MEKIIAVLKNLGIDTTKVRRTNYIVEEDYLYAELVLRPSEKSCPHCGSVSIIIKEYKPRHIECNSAEYGVYELDFKVPRFFCKDCYKTFTQQIEAKDGNSKYSKKLVNALLEDFKTPVSFSHISKIRHVPLQTVIDIFDSKVPVIEHPITEAICIDEFKNQGRAYGNYSCIIIDFTTSKIIKIIPDRTLDTLAPAIFKIPKNSRDIVKYIITDMYDGYITVAKSFFKNATIAIDPFHYSKYFINAVQAIRRRLADNDKLNIPDKTWMNTHWKALTMNFQKDYDPKKEKGWTLSDGTHISTFDRVSRFVSRNNELLEAFLLLQNYYFRTKSMTYEQASSYFDSLIKELETSKIPELIKLSNTYKNYKDYIVNSFIVFNNRRLSNGPVEGVNSRIKTIAKNQAGYRNQDRFNKRCLYVINSKSRE